MLNYIWAFMILIGVVYATCTGHIADVTGGALDSAGDAISLCITMAGVVALWMGLMEIAKEAGLITKLTKGISPFLDFMFPWIPKQHPARGYIATNIIANVMGLGWACTPAGLKAMEELANLEAERGNPEYIQQISTGERMPDRQERNGQVSRNGNVVNGNAAKNKGKGGADKGSAYERTASNEMCTFLILNISSLQLIPVNMIAYRSQYGSENPAGIIAPAIFATLCSTIIAIIYCKAKDRKRGM